MDDVSLCNYLTLFVARTTLETTETDCSPDRGIATISRQREISHGESLYVCDSCCKHSAGSMDSFLAKRSRALKIRKVSNGKLSMAKAAMKVQG